MTHPAGGPGPAAQSARERASRSFLILAPAALVGSGEDLSRTSLLHCFHQSLSSSMASQWTLSGEMTLKVQAILWQGDEAHRPWSQDAWAQISSFLSDIKSRTGPTHAGGGHPTWHSVSQADGDASDRVSSRQEFGPDPTGTQTWKKGKGHSVRTDVRAPSITQAAESPPRSVLTFPERLLALPRRCDGAGAVLLPPPCSPALSFWGEQRGHHIQTSHPGSAGWILVASGTKAQVSGEMSHLPLFRAPLLRKAVKGLLGASHELLNAFQNELALEREKGNLSG
ncbi:uncharacterized protein [Globicephala melas]|uniref:uncharacterized protein isoform X1 n=2 Tax=Globicephala melas TaxID=9731 RepID=UPI00293D9A10|nr:uncharacterized protein LOC115861825 isoform X1 [Globicephala melas]XP_060150684.1 uncharacterized protein LOC115861825 isoform X1 [Globicephala melas]XP_060150686.1 uncharacterized protein LOC115861825 isoform X1 [Globicephala melas]